MQVDLSIIIPAYNEQSRLPVYLEGILAFLGARGDLSYEIVVVDDGSTDSTAAVVAGFAEENRRVKLLRFPENRGKGHAVRSGMLQARGRRRLFADADGATPIAELERLERKMAEGVDLAIASRALPDERCKVNARLHRKVVGTVFNLMVRSLTVKGISDTQCGFKLFTAESAMSLFPLQRIEGFGFDVELLFLSRRKGYRIAEVPVNWNEVEGSKVKVLRDSCRMFLDVVTVRLNALRGRYGREAGARGRREVRLDGDDICRGEAE